MRTHSRSRKKDFVLTEYQKKLIEDNIALAYDRAYQCYRSYIKTRPRTKLTQVEFISAAHLGLCYLASKYDTNSGTKFSTYAYSALDWYIRRWAKEEESTIYIPKYANINFDIVSLEEQVSENDDGDTLTYDDIVSHDDHDYEVIELNSVIEQCLDERERDMLIMFYCHGYTKTEISKKYNVSVTRVNFLIERAKSKVRQALVA